VATVAVVTGAGRGIGRAVAGALAARGFNVVVNDTGGSFDGRGDDAAVAEIAAGEIEALGGTATWNNHSIATVAGAQRLIECALERFGRIDVLVNNAGITRQNMVWDMSEADFDEVLATNLKGQFACVHAAAPHMMEQRSGSIVNMSSGVSMAGSVATSNYCASKAGVIGFSFATAMELGRFGIRVNAIFPAGHTRLHTKPEPWRDRYRITERPPMPDDAWPVEAVLPVVLYLASDESREVNGQLFAAGGASIGWYAGWSPAREVATPAWTDTAAIDAVMAKLLKGVANPSPAQSVAIDDFVWPWVRPGGLPAAHDASDRHESD
jgi:NAD(P)-dependent dehydrogenase (short-subunit alcohol dehydrogenase family)